MLRIPSTNLAIYTFLVFTLFLFLLSQQFPFHISYHIFNLKCHIIRT